MLVLVNTNWDSKIPSSDDYTKGGGGEGRGGTDYPSKNSHSIDERKIKKYFK